jgi:hypothetical protein
MNLPLTKDQLLAPRYRLLIDYPGNEHPIGHVFTIEGDETLVEIWCKEREKYKEIFERLEWWEDRTDEEFPEYIKDKETNEVYKVSTRLPNEPYRIYATNMRHRLNWYIIRDFIPSTKEEFYKQYA